MHYVEFIVTKNVDIVGHASYYACQKCMAEDIYNRPHQKVCFPRIPITDNERRNELRIS